MSTFTEFAVARDRRTENFSKQLAELATLVGISVPKFRGKLLYKEHGIERWLIETRIPGRKDDPAAEDMVYETRYPNWECSVEIAMQGAMAHICNEVRFFIPRDSHFRHFGERHMDGTPVSYIDKEYLSVCRRYMMDR